MSWDTVLRPWFVIAMNSGSVVGHKPLHSTTSIGLKLSVIICLPESSSRIESIVCLLWKQVEPVLKIESRISLPRKSSKHSCTVPKNVGWRCNPLIMFLSWRWLRILAICEMKSYNSFLDPFDVLISRSCLPSGLGHTGYVIIGHHDWHVDFKIVFLLLWYRNTSIALERLWSSLWEPNKLLLVLFSWSFSSTRRCTRCSMTVIECLYICERRS